MKTINKLLATAAIAFTAFSFSSGAAQAQTESVTATVVVQNALTITEVDALNFGTVAAISDAVQVASLFLNPSTGVLLPTTTGAPAVFAVIDDTAATAALLNVEDGADAATINITINNVVNPISGPTAFTLLPAGWSTSWNGGANTARTAGTPFTQTFAAAFGGGVNTLAIGATLNTNTAVALYPDATYAGSFDVVFSY